MKKGCFFSSIIILTLVVAAGVYIFQNHFESFILNPGRKLLVKFVREDLDAKLEKVIDSPEKRELKKLIYDFSENTEAIKKLKENEVNKIVSLIEDSMADSIIQKNELEEISKLIESKLK